MVCFHVRAFQNRGFGVLLLISFEFIFVSCFIGSTVTLLIVGIKVSCS